MTQWPRNRIKQARHLDDLPPFFVVTTVTRLCHVDYIRLEILVPLKILRIMGSPGASVV